MNKYISAGLLAVIFLVAGIFIGRGNLDKKATDQTQPAMQTEEAMKEGCLVVRGSEDLAAVPESAIG